MGDAISVHIEQNLKNMKLYDYIYKWKDGFSGFKLNNKYGIIKQNEKNEKIVLVEATYDYISEFYNGLAEAQKGSLRGMLDKNGNLVVDCIHEELYLPAEGLIGVRKGNKWGFIDYHGHQKIDFLFDKTDLFSEGLCEVQKNKKSGFINTLGVLVIDYQHDAAYRFSEGLCAVKKGNNYKDEKWGFIDHNGNIVIDFQYKDVLSFSEGLAAVCLKYNWGFIDKTGKIVLDFKYPEVTSFENGIAEVFETQYIDDPEYRADTFGSERMEHVTLYYINKEGAKIDKE